MASTTEAAAEKQATAGLSLVEESGRPSPELVSREILCRMSMFRAGQLTSFRAVIRFCHQLSCRFDDNISTLLCFYEH